MFINILKKSKDLFLKTTINVTLPISMRPLYHFLILDIHVNKPMPVMTGNQSKTQGPKTSLRYFLKDNSNMGSTAFNN